jgi:hypothetical protein
MPQLRVPSGLASIRGLGSKRTMPHLTPGGSRLAQGGGLNPVSEIYAADRPKLYNPRARAVLEAVSRTPMANREMFAMPGSTARFPYAEGGPAPEETEPELQEQASPEDDEARQVVLEAMAALEGQSEDAEGALADFIDLFGAQALADLQQMVEAKHQKQTQTEEEEDEEAPEQPEDEEAEGEEAPEELAQAGGGLLEGDGTGQSDEIEGVTPSGRPVLLSDGEYVIDAPTVSALGDGSTAAGARRLDDFRKQVRANAWGHDKQAKPMKKGSGGVVVRLR